MRHRRIALFAFIAAATFVAASLGRNTHAEDTSGVARLSIVDRKVGAGAPARTDSDVQIQYTGWLYDAQAKDHHGAKFDSSYDSGQPLSFTVGAEQVIAGLDHGILGMRVGGVRTLIIPPNLGYGRRGAGTDIPPGATLVFDIELIGAH